MCDVYLSNIHRLGYNYRHFGLICRSIRHNIALRKLEGSNKSQAQHLESCLIVEGLARTVKNLVRLCGFGLGLGFELGLSSGWG